jgi:hypothetical protein
MSYSTYQTGCHPYLVVILLLMSLFEFAFGREGVFTRSPPEDSQFWWDI